MKRALVVVHLSSLDAYAEGVGLEEAWELAGRLREAILGHDGPIYVIDQRWPFTEWSEPRWTLVREVELKKDIQWMHFEDEAQEWTVFLNHFRKRLIRDRVTNVLLGGVWYNPGDPAGCVSDTYLFLRRRFIVRVDESLVGCLPVRGLGR